MSPGNLISGEQKSSMKRCLVIVFAYIVILAAGPKSLLESSAATIKGQIDSDRIKQFDNFIVYIKYASPKLFTSTEETVASVQKNFKIYPKVLPILRNMNVIFVNNDSEMHNIHAAIGSPVDFNYGIPPNARTSPVKFHTEGEAMLLCNIHPEMKGYILVLQNPFFAKVDEKGNFMIQKVPKGKYELITWHDEYVSRKELITIENDNQTNLVKFTY